MKSEGIGEIEIMMCKGMVSSGARAPSHSRVDSSPPDKLTIRSAKIPATVTTMKTHSPGLSNKRRHFSPRELCMGCCRKVGVGPGLSGKQRTENKGWRLFGETRVLGAGVLGTFVERKATMINSRNCNSLHVNRRATIDGQRLGLHQIS